MATDESNEGRAGRVGRLGRRLLAVSALGRFFPPVGPDASRSVRVQTAPSPQGCTRPSASSDAGGWNATARVGTPVRPASAEVVASLGKPATHAPHALGEAGATVPAVGSVSERVAGVPLAVEPETLPITTQLGATLHVVRPYVGASWN